MAMIPIGEGEDVGNVVQLDRSPELLIRRIEYLESIAIPLISFAGRGAIARICAFVQRHKDEFPRIAGEVERLTDCVLVDEIAHHVHDAYSSDIVLHLQHCVRALSFVPPPGLHALLMAIIDENEHIAECMAKRASVL